MALTFDEKRVIDAAGTMAGKHLGGAFRSQDGARTYDSTGAFLVGELERLDMTMHEPLAAVTWSRDIDLREDVTIADEASSFTVSSFGSASGLGKGLGNSGGKSWAGKNTNEVNGVSVDIAKIANPLNPWVMELKYTVLELESAAKLGRPVDQQKYEALQLKHQMDIDAQVYIGDDDLGLKGLFNSSLVTAVANLANGVSGFSQWTKKTPDEILTDVNVMLNTTWANSGYKVIPSKIALPPQVFGYIATQKVSNAGNVSILKYILENNLLTRAGEGQLEVVPVKWLVGAGIGGTIGVDGTHNRAVVYTQEKRFVRYPMTLLQRTPIQYDSIYHKTSYYCRLGATEIVYPETVSYWDGC